MSFQQQLAAILIDRIAAAILILLAAFLIYKLLTKFQLNQVVGKKIEKQNASKKLEFLEKQLSELYWPLFIRLHRDNVLWKKILDKRKGEDALRQAVGEDIIQNFVLPNHEEIEKIVLSKIHLAKSDDRLHDLLLRYIRHITVYKAIRKAESYDKDPIRLNEPWPYDLFPTIERRTKELQAEYEKLMRKYEE